MINLFDSFFTKMREIKGDIVYPFHVTFMTNTETEGNFHARYGELDEPFEGCTHYGLYISALTYRTFAMPLTSEQYESLIKTQIPLYASD